MRLWIAGVVMLALGAGLACAPAGAASEISPERLEALLETLDSTDFGEREEGTRALTELYGGRTDDLLDVLKERELSAEQRVRVLQVAREGFVNRPRAAIGITMDLKAAWTGNGARVREMHKDFPAQQFRQVRPGDVILRIEETELKADRDLALSTLVAEVTSREPGEKIRVKILRPKTYNQDNAPLNEAEMVDAEEIETTITLGSWRDLRVQGVPGRLSEVQLERAWRYRLVRSGVSLRGEQEVLLSKTKQTGWAHGRQTVISPPVKFVIAADSQLATILSLSNGMRASVGREKRDFVVTRQMGKAAKVVDDAAEGEALFEIEMVRDDMLPRRVRDQRLEMLRLANEIGRLRRDMLDRQRSTQDRELIRARLEQVIEEHRAAETRFNDLRAEIQDNGGD